MKRLTLVASIIVLAACSGQQEAPAVDSAAPAMAPAPAMTDSAATDSTAATTPDSAAK